MAPSLGLYIFVGVLGRLIYIYGGAYIRGGFLTAVNSITFRAVILIDTVQSQFPSEKRLECSFSKKCGKTEQESIRVNTLMIVFISV